MVRAQVVNWKQQLPKTAHIAKLFAIDDKRVMCMKSPQCVLLRQNRNRGARFTSLEDSSIPVFPIERSITIKNHSIRRGQVPMCAAFSLTDYETQGQTFSKALLDLVSKGRDSHREFCSLYIEIGLLTTSERLHLLEKIRMSERPHPDLWRWRDCKP